MQVLKEILICIAILGIAVFPTALQNWKGNQ